LVKVKPSISALDKNFYLNLGTICAVSFTFAQNLNQPWTNKTFHLCNKTPHDLETHAIGMPPSILLAVTFSSFHLPQKL